MTTTSYELVREFHEIFNHPINDEPTINIPKKHLRYSMLAEEYAELVTNYGKRNWVEVADALGDIEYVAVGGEVAFGVEIYEIVLEGLTLGEIIGEMTDALDMLEFGINLESAHTVTYSLSRIFALNRAFAALLDYPLDEIVEAVHESNLSKLDEDGNPVYYPEGHEKAGKVAKGPNFVPPTVKIAELIEL